MRILYFLSRVTSKVKINHQVYKILNMLCGISRNIPLTYNWKDFLSQINPDGGASCLCRNEIASKEECVNLEIIISIYNTEQYVAECIESALNQKTNYSYRVIIVNDGSTDNSPAIINRYANDPHVRIIHQENRGFSGARNRALEHITGRYITFLDSDDCLPKDAVEKLLSKAYEGDYDIVGGGYSRFGGGRPSSEIIPAPGQLYGFPWGKVYKSHLWNHLQFPDNYWFEDTIFAMIVHDMAKKKTCIQEIVYKHRTNQNSISFKSVGKPKVIDSLWVTIKSLKDREKLGLPFDDRFRNRLIHQFKVNTCRIYTLGDKQVDQANYQASKELYECYYGKDGKCKDATNQQILEAILHDDYRQFILACLFL